MVVEMLESIENLFTPMKIHKNIMKKQCLLMRGCWWKCWNAAKTIKTFENTSKYYGKATFINAGILAEMFERIENLLNPLKIQANIIEKQGLLMW